MDRAFSRADLRQERIEFGFSGGAWTDAVQRGDIDPRPRAAANQTVFVRGHKRSRYHLKARLLKDRLKEVGFKANSVVIALGHDAFACREVRHPDIPEGELLTQIGQRLLPSFEAAYDSGLDPDAQAANIAVFAEGACNSYLAISHRRLFIKALVTEWFRQKEEGQRVITPETAAAAIMGQSEQLMVLAGARPGRY